MVTVTLVEDIHRATLGDYFERFIPSDKIKELSTARIVQSVLDDSSIDAAEVENLTQYVLNQPAKKLFLLLVLCEKIEWTDGEPLRIALKETHPSSPEWFEREMRVLEGIQKIVLENPGLHIVTPIAGYKRKGSKTGFLMFPWAQEGNLKELWDREENRDGAVLPDSPRTDFLLWTLRQMRGLCEALVQLHLDRPIHGSSTGGNTHCRHGDLKPENILVFREQNTNILKIADVGLGKFHAKSTDNRMKGNEYTRTMTGTARYMPPEFDPRITRFISRRHDVWSLGCLFMEFIIWAAWGVKGLNQFSQVNIEQFWQDTHGSRVVHKSIKQWIGNITSVLPKETALGDLIRLVDSQMLKPLDYRSTSKEVCEPLNAIVQRAHVDEAYCLNSERRLKIIGYSLPSSVPGSRSRGQEYVSKAGTEIHVGCTNPYTESLDFCKEVSEFEDKWQPHAANGFAQRLWETMKYSSQATGYKGWMNGASPLLEPPRLCARCSELDLWQPDLRFTVTLSILLTDTGCQLCSLIKDCLSDLALPDYVDEITIQRNGPTLEVEPGNRSILSFYDHPVGSTKVDKGLSQVGTTQLPAPGSADQFLLFLEWIQLCDETHEHDGHATNHATAGTLERIKGLPTRVVDVGDDTNHYVRLVKSEDMVSPIYLALSHRWGESPQLHIGRILRNNHTRRYRSIDDSELPLNFKDAVTVARGVGVRYIWIDSLCIIQDDDDDWNVESVKMEQVYSNALCVLAASSAGSSMDGFLKRSDPYRPYMVLKSQSGGISYLCKNIDNFERDVDEAILNTRGWTLQERALARRTVHFTDNQVYFECGKGVHCESLSRLTNPRPSFLGDSNFPSSVEPRYKGGRVMLVQDLYQQYSKRIFWDAKDRPVAIAALEKRLTAVFDTRGGFGVFQAFLERGLLWKRPDKTPFLKNINFPQQRNVPSWSWMAYDGLISYVEVDFDEVDWTKEYSSPFATQSAAYGKWHWEADGTNWPPMVGLTRAREMNLAQSRDELFKTITFDVSNGYLPADLRCVVLGKAKSGDTISPLVLSCYVIIVKYSMDSFVRGAFTRVGAGVLKEDQMVWGRYEAGNLY
ncbi:Ff.00g100600.m01.CDS01 [Fusarium sp. VM40]|nr:Ff.00g100600.m01.CDS01 [Fusarium sp. VM40]